MVDRVSSEKRSEIMRSVGTEDTGPEMIVRSAAHRLGFRFRLHDRKLPGKPDLVLPRWRTVIFVHGCFWHRHQNCKKATTPRSNVDFWEKKFSANVVRDARNCEELQRQGWRVVIIWQCEAASLDAAIEILKKRLGAKGRRTTTSRKRTA